MATTCEPARRTAIRAFRHGASVLIVAEGELPHAGYDVEIELRPEDIFPSWYEVRQCVRPGFFPPVLVPYRVSQTINHPKDEATVRVFHADGEDDVTIEPCGVELAAYAAVVGGAASGDEEAEPGDVATGFSKILIFDDAFQDALTRLPPIEPAGPPDTMHTVRVEEIGALFGGVAGFHDLYVRIRRTHD